MNQLSKIVYICDGENCPSNRVNCYKVIQKEQSGEQVPCHHTTNISHAKNFTSVGLDGKYREKTDGERGVASLPKDKRGESFSVDDHVTWCDQTWSVLSITYYGDEKWDVLLANDTAVHPEKVWSNEVVVKVKKN